VELHINRTDIGHFCNEQCRLFESCISDHARCAHLDYLCFLGHRNDNDNSNTNDEPGIEHYITFCSSRFDVSCRTRCAYLNRAC
jgi:hypothetical protein